MDTFITNIDMMTHYLLKISEIRDLVVQSSTNLKQSELIADQSFESATAEELHAHIKEVLKQIDSICGEIDELEICLKTARLSESAPVDPV